MSATFAWGLLKTPVIFIAAAFVLALGALMLLSEYKKLFMHDPRPVMSAEVLMAIISRGSGPGYLAAFLLAGALINLGLGLYYLVDGLPHLLRAWRAAL